MKINKLITKLIILGALFLASCSSDDDSIQEPKGDYENGILISGEGSGASTGSVTFVSDDFVTSENLIYKNVNGAELGIYLQSMAFDDTRAFIVVDNTNTVTAVDRYTFEEQAIITTDLENPRYMVAVGDKGYVTNWGATGDETDDFVAVIDLTTYSVEKTISVGNGPERIVAKNGVLYVSHKGAFTTNNVVSVINIASENVQEVIVNDKPDELVFNSAGNLVVLSGGQTLYDANWNVIGNTLGSISTVDVSSLAVTELDFADGEHPSFMVINNGTLYYALNGGIYEMDENATTLPTTSTLTSEGYLYGMEVGDGSIYTLDASFSDVSTLNVYDVTSKTKTQSVSVGLGASKIYFN